MSSLDERTGFTPEGLALRWLVQVRWVAVFVQLTGILAVRAFIEPPTMVLIALALTTTATNLWALRLDPRPSLPGLLLLFDTFLLTLILFLTGGAANPFSILYLVYIALAAVVLSARWTTALAVSAILSLSLIHI